MPNYYQRRKNPALPGSQSNLVKCYSPEFCHIFTREAVRLGVERVAHISQAFLCAYGVLIPLPCCSPKFATFARTANALVGIDDPTPAEADLSVPIFEKMTFLLGACKGVSARDDLDFPLRLWAAAPLANQGAARREVSDFSRQIWSESSAWEVAPLSVRVVAIP